MLKGIDVSHWNGKNAVPYYVANPPEVINAKHIDFVIAKATEGATYVDPLFHTHIYEATRQSKLIGAYHYARPENNSPAKEAINFAKAVAPYNGRCLYALDVEGKALVQEGIEEWVLAWLMGVETMLGVKPLVYISTSFINKLSGIPAHNYGLWAANWGTTDIHKVNSLTKPWPFTAIHQFTNIPVDCDMFYGSPMQWLAYCNATISGGTITDPPVNETSHRCGCCYGECLCQKE